MLTVSDSATVPQSSPAAPPVAWSLPLLDRLVIAYLALPLVIFIGGWLQLWVALPLLGCAALALAPLVAPRPLAAADSLPITPLHLWIAILAGGAWTVFGGIGHLFFTNADWHIRDAMLHDLVVSPWPVGYGTVDGLESILRAPVAFFLPAALLGKWAGLAAAHAAMGLWTAIGASLFLLQVLSLTRARAGAAIGVAAVVILWSGLDIVGCLLESGPHFRAGYQITMHLEWWAWYYLYPSMTTQLFWMPNHALGGWLAIGLIFRDRQGTRFDALLPIVVVAAALWSPLTLVGLLPFVAWKVVADMRRERSWGLLNPAVWAPALVVGIVIAGYLTLDLNAIPAGWSLVQAREGAVPMLFRQAQFFLLEAGLIGFAILAIRRSAETGLALGILAVLPLAYFGPGNDLVMRASVPSLTVLLIGSCLALLQETADARGRRKKLVLGGLLALGAVTPVQEFARAVMLPAWPINLQATLIGASCGFPPHYVAHLGEGMAGRFLRTPKALPLGPLGPESCTNPAAMLMYAKGIW